MACHIRGGSRRLLAAIAQCGNAQLREGAGALLFPRGRLVSVDASAGARLSNLRRFTTGTPPSWAAAASGTEPLIEQMQDKIRTGLGGADEVEVIDVSGDARHVSIRVVSKAFEGKNAINRQRLVYKCIWEEMQSERVHAVQGIETKTPEELAAK